MATRREIAVLGLFMLVILVWHQIVMMGHNHWIYNPTTAAPVSKTSEPDFRAALEDTTEWHPVPVDILQLMSSWAATNRTVHYMCPIGNGGDALITYATYQVFHRAGVVPRPLSDALIARSSKARKSKPQPIFDIVVLGGGGNFVPLYHFISKRILKLSLLSKLVVLLPHTIRGHEDLLAQLGSNVQLFCRDVPSYNHAVLHATGGAKVEFGFDMAIHLQLPESILSVKPTLGTLHAFRADVEKTTVELPSGNIDVSAKWTVRSGSSFADAEKIALLMLGVVAQHSAVMTNRLHVVVAAWHLKRPVLAYDNDYGKVKDVLRVTPGLASNPLVMHHFDDNTVDLTWPNEGNRP
jgi:exopolysaccharide biosynthesis predicted pyruvyltransferase EpsI